MKRAIICILILGCLSGCGKENDMPVEPSSQEDAVIETNSETESETEIVSETESVTLTDDTFVRVLDYIPTIQQELRYATTNNFTGQVIYTFEDAYLRYGTVKKLQKVSEDLAKYGLGIKVWDAFRPLQAQAKLWEICPDEKYVSHPDKGNRNHCRGLAIDMTLYLLETGEEIEMPSDFDEFSTLGDRDYSECSKEVKELCVLLESIMKKHGFKGYSKEWWHYNDTESYPIEEQFVPADR